MVARGLAIAVLLVGLQASSGCATSKTGSHGGDFEIVRTFDNGIWAKSHPGDDWLRVDLACDCRFDARKMPFVEGHFQRSDPVAFHYSASTLRGASGSGGIRLFSLEEVERGGLFWKIKASDGNRLWMNVTDFRKGGITNASESRTFYLAAIDVESPTLSMEIEFNRQQVQVQTSSGNGFLFARSKVFAANSTGERTYQFSFSLHEPMRVEISRDPYVTHAYSNATWVEPTYRIRNEVSNWTFSSTNNGISFVDSEGKGPYRNAEIAADPGNYTIEIEYPEGTEEARRILPYVIGIPRDPDEFIVPPTGSQ